MNQYTDSASRPGQRLGTGDERALFLTEFGQIVLEAYDETITYNGMTFVQHISGAKAHSFPIIGRKRDESEHTPGDLITGGKVEHNDILIEVDNMLVDAAFIPEIDNILNHYDLARPYARQIGQSLAVGSDRRKAIMHILASRVTDAPYTGGPLPSYHFHASMASSPEQLEDAAWKAVEHIKENDIAAAGIKYMLPWQQYLLLARYGGWQGGSGSTVPSAMAPVFNMDSRKTAQAGPQAGISVGATNMIPKTNITTGPEKYRGNFTTTVGHIGTEMAVGTLVARGLKVVIKEQEERLGTILIGSQLEGNGKLRPECSFEVTTASR